MSGNFPIGSDVYALIEQKIGPRIAWSLLLLLILAAAVGGATVILAPLKPFMPLVWGVAASGQRWSSYLQFGGAILALAAMIWFASRVQRRLGDNDRQLSTLQRHTKITEIVLDDLRPMQDEIDSLKTKVRALENHTHIQENSPLFKLMLKRELERQEAPSLRALKSSLNLSSERDDDPKQPPR